MHTVVLWDRLHSLARGRVHTFSRVADGAAMPTRNLAAAAAAIAEGGDRHRIAARVPDPCGPACTRQPAFLRALRQSLSQSDLCRGRPEEHRHRSWAQGPLRILFTELLQSDVLSDF